MQANLDATARIKLALGEQMVTIESQRDQIEQLGALIEEKDAEIAKRDAEIAELKGHAMTSSRS